MAKFKTGDRVKWIKKMAIVPHPEGKTDRHGEVLPVFRDKEMTGEVMGGGANNKMWIRPDSTIDFSTKICGERYYDVHIPIDELTLID